MDLNSIWKTIVEGFWKAFDWLLGVNDDSKNYFN